ncbi:hypothetical protein [Streptomyces sp. NPDC048473]|uniref:hypothetical protein n=1 Tax=Streptomyces sp. NPDC048473 TaxID=3365556 RepID=UPI0037128358
MSLPLGIDPVYAVAAVGVLALVLAGWSIRRNRTRAGAPRAGTPTVWVAALAALGCTAYSAETSWFFAADYLGMTDTVQRAAFFSTAELALFANALLARQNLRNQGAPGVPGTLVWVLTGVQIIPAYAESGPVGGTVRAIVGPVMAAMLWHLAMGIELRLHKPDASSQGLLATLGREVRERLLSRLGVATRNRDAAQITRERATERAGALASRLAKMPEKDRTNRHGRRIERRLETALSRSGVGTDPDQRRALLEQLAARRHAAALASVALPSPWTQPSWEQDDHRGDRSPRGTALGTRTLPEEQVSPTGTVPEAGPRTAASIGDRAVGDAAEPVGDGPHTVPNDNGDREHPDTETGTEPNGDRPHTVPLRRKPPQKGSRNRPGAGQAKRSRNGPRLTVEQMVERVRPHVPALLERDGNASVTRPQLREILRAQNIQGGRNERLTPVLQLLRDEAATTTTRSTVR